MSITETNYANLTLYFDLFVTTKFYEAAVQQNPFPVEFRVQGEPQVPILFQTTKNQTNSMYFIGGENSPL